MSAKRNPGRPRVYDGYTRRRVATAVAKHGLVRALPVLAEQGVCVSLAVLRSVAKEKGISLTRGRPKLVA